VPIASPATPSFLVEDQRRLRRILESARTVAVVGLSSNTARPSNGVARTLLRYGFDIIPVNPHETEVLGIRAVPDLKTIGRPVDIVDVFRRSSEVGPHADEAIAIGAKVLWMQQGVIDPHAARRAHVAGLEVVMGRCMARDLAALGIQPQR
jgi:predicted CoA-binding protein